MLYGGGGSEEFIAYQNAAATGSTNWGLQVSGFAWNLGANGFSYGWAASQADSSQGYYYITYDSTPVHYGWNQYVNIDKVNQGVPGLDNGVVCSTSLTMWQQLGAQGYGPPVLPRTYDPKLVNVGANALYNAVKSECEQSNGFFSSIGAALEQIGYATLCGACGADCGLCWAGIGCGNMPSYDGDPCDEAADQMVNTFVSNMAGYSDDCSYGNEYLWKTQIETLNALSASPDDVACWNGNGSGAPCTGPGSSIWGFDNNNPVQWNAGGTVYGCWD
jgi:hypothetical protein